MKAILILVTLLFTSSAFAQSWLDVFNRYRVAHSVEWKTPDKISRTDLRPYVTLARRTQPCQDCTIVNLSDAGRFALAMQGTMGKKSATSLRSPKGETLLTDRDMEFLRTHAWDGAGKIYLGATSNLSRVTPQTLVMAMVTQIGVRNRAIAVGFSDSHEDTLVWGYRLLPLAEGDLGEPYARDGKMVYPVTLRMNVYFHEPIEEASLAPFDFQSGRDQIYNKLTRVGKHTSVLTLRARFHFDSAVTLGQNGFRADGNGRLVDQGEWLDENKIAYVWVSNPYGSSAAEHPALTPVALKLIENGNWNAPELTKRLTTEVKLLGAHYAFPWLSHIDLKNYEGSIEGQKLLIAKKIEHGFHRMRMAVKVWPESIVFPQSEGDHLEFKITFYGNYDQLKVIKVFEQLNLRVDYSDS